MLRPTRSAGDASVHCTFRATRNKTNLRARLEYEFERLGFVRPDRNFLALGAELFVPRLDRVGARRKILQIEVAIFVGHDKIRMLEYYDVASHPRMYVALDRNRDLLAREGFF